MPWTINHRDHHFQHDPNSRVDSFNRDLAARNQGRILYCTRLLDLPVGFARSNHRYGGYCDYMPFEAIDDEIGVQTKIQATFHRVASRRLDPAEVEEGESPDIQLVEYKILAAARFVPADADEDEIEQDDRFGEVVAIFSALYLMKEELDEETLVEFGMRNATFHVWPYWRELLHSTTGRFRLPPTVLPMFQFPPPGQRSQIESASDWEAAYSDACIDLDERYEVAYWTSVFSVTEAQLRRTIAEFGNRVVDVRQALVALRDVEPQKTLPSPSA